MPRKITLARLFWQSLKNFIPYKARRTSDQKAVCKNQTLLMRAAAKIIARKFTISKK
jgi:hypothetical protein